MSSRPEEAREGELSRKGGVAQQVQLHESNCPAPVNECDPFAFVKVLL